VLSPESEPFNKIVHFSKYENYVFSLKNNEVQNHNSNDQCK